MIDKLELMQTHRHILAIHALNPRSLSTLQLLLCVDVTQRRRSATGQGVMKNEMSRN